LDFVEKKKKKKERKSKFYKDFNSDNPPSSVGIGPDNWLFLKKLFFGALC